MSRCGSSGEMEVRPCTIRAAKKWNSVVHRRLKELQGARWAVCVQDRGEVVGVAIVGNPSQEWQHRDILSVLRVAVLEGHPNACSMLYGACSRAARAMGARGLVTYTHLDETGTSLRASGWISDGVTRGGEYDRPSRRRKPVKDSRPKRRWWAPWSEAVRSE